MTLNLQNKYPGRFDPVSADYPQGKFKNRSSPTAQDGSYMERDWLNDWAGFFGALLNGAGVTPNGSVDTAQSSQLYDALRIVTGAKFGSALIGELVHWPLQLMPQDIFPNLGQVYIPYTGQAFSKTTYPLLGLVHPSGTLPVDMRGEFVRGFDNGRGVNASQALMAWADSKLKAHHHEMPTARMVTGVDAVSSTWVVVENDFANPKVVSKSTGDNESAPRCYTWNMIVRAA